MELKDLLKLEEVKWLQRYKDKEIKEDSNTRYYSLRPKILVIKMDKKGCI